MRRAVLTALALLGVAGPSACGGGPGSDADLTIYSGRNEQLIGPLLERFERESGLAVDVRYGDSAELAATIAEEGGNSPADVFFSQDAGALGAVEESLEVLPQALLEPVPARFRDPRKRWTGVSGRARVISFNAERLEEADVPDSVFELTQQRWRGRVGIPPPNASFQAFVSAMRAAVGDSRTRKWLEDMKANDVRTYDNNIQTVEAVSSGEIDLGLVNHYYLYELKREDPELAADNHFPADGDPGSLVNAAGVGILESSEQQENARRFAKFLLARPSQEFFSERTFEYPLIDGVEPPANLPTLDQVEGPDVMLGQLGGKLRSTLKLLDDVGLTT